MIGTLRRECLDRVLILGRRHLETVLAECIEHYNSHRPHRSLSQRAPSALDTAPALIGDVDLARLRRTDHPGGPSTSTGWSPELGGWVLGTDTLTPPAVDCPSIPFSLLPITMGDAGFRSSTVNTGFFYGRLLAEGDREAVRTPQQVVDRAGDPNTMCFGEA